MTTPTKSFRDIAAHRGAWLIPVLLGLIVRFPVLMNALVYDDHTLITLHPEISDPGFVTEIFSRDYGLEFGMRTPNGYYRPAFMLLNWGLYQFVGASPFVYHAASLAIFALTVFATFGCLRALLADERWALVGSICYAIHPINTELLVIFASVPDLVVQAASAFSIWMIVRQPEWNRPLLVAIAAFLLGFLSSLFKETAFLLIGWIALGSLFFAMLHARPRWISAMIPVGLMVGLALGLALRATADLDHGSLGKLFMPFTVSGASAGWTGLLTALYRVLVPQEYIAMIDREIAPVTGAAILSVVAALSAILVTVLLMTWNRQHAMLLTLWITASTYALVLPLAQGLPYADRYFAAGPWCAIGAILMRSASRRWPAIQKKRRLIYLLAGLWMAVACARSLAGNFKCQTAVSFWRSFLEDQPHSIYPRVGLAGTAFFELGDFELTEKLANEVIRRAPEHRFADEMTFLIVEIRIHEQKFSSALKVLDEVNPRAKQNRQYVALQAIALHGLGETAAALSSLDEAMITFTEDAGLRLQWIRLAIGEHGIPLERIIDRAKECVALGGDPPTDFLELEKLKQIREQSPRK